MSLSAEIHTSIEAIGQDVWDRLAPDDRKFVEAMYHEEILATDAAVGVLLEALQARENWDETVVVLTSDHGEELWDHGGFEHNHSLHPELMRTMLWIRPPHGWADGPHRLVAKAAPWDRRAAC